MLTYALNAHDKGVIMMVGPTYFILDKEKINFSKINIKKFLPLFFPKYPHPLTLTVTIILPNFFHFPAK
jgi:hypothetical protein